MKKFRRRAVLFLGGIGLILSTLSCGGDEDVAQLISSLFFNANDGSNGYELWKTDGTSAGTVLVKDINPGAGSSNPFND
jgi:ELWxxDGT repeat protein